MKTFKTKYLVGALATGLLSTVLIGGISASADELTTEVQSLDVGTLPSKVFDVYQLDSFYLSTTSVEELTTSNSELSLEEYLIENIENFNTTIDISSYGITTSNVDIIKETLNKIRLTHPELFSLDSSYATGSLGRKVKQLVLNYTCTEEEYSEQLATIDNKFDEIISRLDDSMSDKEKALAVHDYICANFYYDSTLGTFDMYNFVVNGSGVCQAYMLTYNYILNKLGIDSYAVISDDINHTWNIVNLDGEYYQVDVTWDDYTYQLLGWANHNYFMLTDEEIYSTHGDWYTYEDVSATDTDYQACEFKSSHCPCVAIDGKLFYIDDGKFCQYDFSQDTLTSISNILSNKYWADFSQSSKVFYSDKFSSLNPYKDVIFYNTPDSIIAMDIDGNLLGYVYTYSSSSDAIYGINIQDGYLIAQFEPNLDYTRSDFATNIQVICNVEEWYQDYLSGADVVSNVTTTTTIDTTVTTSEESTTNITTTTAVTTSQQVTTDDTQSTTTISETSTEIDTTSTTNVTDIIDDNTLLDINLDGDINAKDLLELKSYLIGNNTNSLVFDINQDGYVNVLDLLTLKNNLLNY